MQRTYTTSNIRGAFGRVPRSGLAAVLAIGWTAAAAAAPSVITLPGAQAYPESITSASDGTIYSGSFAMGGVFRVSPGASKGESWIEPGAYGTRSTLGVLADDASKTLWVCSNDLSAMGVQGPGSATGSALVGFDLTTGQGKVSYKLPGARTLCNDIAVGPDKAVYVTNSFEPQILRLPPGGKELEVWVDNPAFEPPKNGAGVDGLAFGSDGNLYVDTFTKGELFRVDVKNGEAGKVTKLQTSQPTALTDGIRPTEGGRALLVVEGDGKLDRVTVEGDKATIETLKTGIDGPTAVTQVGNVAWVSECQLPYLLDPSKKGQGPKLPFKLYAVDLPQK
jgi:sugar lactone lactonase YvrE